MNDAQASLINGIATTLIVAVCFGIVYSLLYLVDETWGTPGSIIFLICFAMVSLIFLYFLIGGEE